MPVRKVKYEAWLSGEDLEKAERNFRRSGLQSRSEYTRQAAAMGAPRIQVDFIARISELALLINTISQQTETEAQVHSRSLTKPLIKEIRRLVRELQLIASNKRS
jgi:hypothetical protein